MKTRPPEPVPISEIQRDPPPCVTHARQWRYWLENGLWHAVAADGFGSYVFVHTNRMGVLNGWEPIGDSLETLVDISL